MSRIQFLMASQTISLPVFLQSELNIELSQAHHLIEFGAVYVNAKRTLNSYDLKSGDLIRCHIQPKRFLCPSDWTPYLHFESDDFLVIEKPPGLPCQPSLDNRIENVLFQVSLKTKQSLFITHRLDVGTKGLMVLAKNLAFQKFFNQALAQRAVTKIYSAITQGPPLALGTYQHWMQPHPRAPKIMSKTPKAQWKLCELELCQRQTLAPTQHRYQIQLLTGRTHQIRAQLSTELNPIHGDRLYGSPITPWLHEEYALKCTELSFTWNQQLFRWSLDDRIDL